MPAGMHTGFASGGLPAAGVAVGRGSDRLTPWPRGPDKLAFSSSPLVGGLLVVDADVPCVPEVVRGCGTEHSVVPVDVGAPLVAEVGSMRGHLLTVRGVEC